MLACTDGPHRLVGDDRPGGGRRVQVLERRPHLAGDHGFCLPRPPLLDALADADDGDEPSGRSRLRLAAHLFIGFPHLPPFRVPEDHVTAAQVQQHRRRDLARVGAGRLPVHVLGAQRHRAAPQCAAQCGQGGEGRAHHHRHLARLALFTGGHGHPPCGQLLKQLPAVLGSFPRGFVHLPVGRDERRAHGRPSVAVPAALVAARYCPLAAGLSHKAATPGSSLPSRNSSDAPPPVEMWVILSATPARSTAATESPPPTMVVACASARARAMAIVPSEKASHSKTPMGPFQTMVRALCTAAANSSRVFGPMSSPCQSGGMASTGTTLCWASGANRSATTTSTGSNSSTPWACACWSSCAASGTRSSSTSDRPTSRPLALRNV